MKVLGSAAALVAMLVLSVASSFGSGQQSCDPSMFEVSQLRAAELSSYNPVFGGGGSWASIAGDVLDTSDLHCRSTVSYLWKLDFVGLNEGVLRAIVFVNRYEDGNPEKPLDRWLGPISSIGMNPEDAANDPAFQSTVVVTAREIERPDESLEEGTYYEITVSGLLGPATAVVRIDFPIMCGSHSSAKENEYPLHVRIIKDVSVDCTESASLSDAGVLQHQFGRFTISAQGTPVILTARQAVRGGIELSYTVTTADGACPGSNTITYPAGQCELLKFCYVAENTGNTRLDSLVVTDQGYTGADSDIVTITMTKTVLEPGETASGEALFYPSPFPGLETWSATADATISESGNGVNSEALLSTAAVGSELCPCVEDGSPITSQRFLCGLETTTPGELECLAEAGSYQNYRCTDERETSTHTCLLAQVNRCRLLTTSLGDPSNYRCEALTATTVSAVLNGEDCYSGTGRTL
mmetsp:Transcript_15563/g.41879  ORF Transcript_15563/g.41879 Transcript_15563/m.41879 type:complete len:469 (+) Transcript_15563:117-1523(+)|eukprot:CAMPEP_0185833518 /NCGR_PEP_ID=MMETSP1353-20130828/3011_1 /TAXON_ID=1077150 /ORGANISM="Erythrolobus australicus, Strain CCMP3124" /LENGTH=468 /DNA_ID=CAMNT_0028531817 /DNA_START=83 /DNA_END=1489 /DNA_ORIENTATION=+